MGFTSQITGKPRPRSSAKYVAGGPWAPSGDAGSLRAPACLPPTPWVLCLPTPQMRARRHLALPAVPTRSQPSYRGWAPSPGPRCAGAQTSALFTLGFETPGADLREFCRNPLGFEHISNFEDTWVQLQAALLRSTMESLRSPSLLSPLLSPAQRCLHAHLFSHFFYKTAQEEVSLAPFS